MNDSQKLLYCTGLDIGQSQEYTAVAVLEQSRLPDPDTPDRHVKHYAVRHLERFPMGTSYLEIGAKLATLFAEPPLQRSPLAVDLTAVGRPVLQLLKRSKIQANFQPMAVGSGLEATLDGDTWVVPRKELASTLQVLLQTRRLKIAPALPAAQLLVSELMKFQVKPKAIGADAYEMWREGPHDDLVLAVAIAAWKAERMIDLWAMFSPYTVRRESIWQRVRW